MKYIIANFNDHFFSPDVNQNCLRLDDTYYIGYEWITFNEMGLAFLCMQYVVGSINIAFYKG